MIAGAWSTSLMLQMIDKPIVCWEVKKKKGNKSWTTWTLARASLPTYFAARFARAYFHLVKVYDEHYWMYKALNKLSDIGKD